MRFPILSALAALALVSAAPPPSPCPTSSDGPRPSRCPSGPRPPPCHRPTSAPSSFKCPPTAPSTQQVQVLAPSVPTARRLYLGCYRPRGGLLRQLGHEGACESQTVKPHYRTAYVCDGGLPGLKVNVCCSDPAPSETRFGTCQRVSGEDDGTISSADSDGGADEEAVGDEGLDASPDVAAHAGVDSHTASLKIEAGCTPDRYKFCCGWAGSNNDCQTSSYGTIEEAEQADFPTSCCTTSPGACSIALHTIRGDCHGTVSSADGEGGADGEAVGDEGLDASPDVAVHAGVDSHTASLEVEAGCTPDRYKICCPNGDCQTSSYRTVEEAKQFFPTACCTTTATTKKCSGDVHPIRGDCTVVPSGGSCFTPVNELRRKSPQEACATHKSKRPSHADLRTAYECTGTNKFACCKGGDTIEFKEPNFGTCRRIHALDYFDSELQQHAAVE